VTGPFVEVRRGRGERAWVNLANVAWIAEDAGGRTTINFSFTRGEKQKSVRLRVESSAREILAGAGLPPPVR
jgi:hypothetical protein